MRRLRSVALGSAVCIISGGIGYSSGVTSERSKAQRSLPSGFPRSCADCESHSEDVPHKRLPDVLKKIVGDENVITSSSDSSVFTIGSRVGKGDALAVCKPGSLREAIDVLKACVEADVAVIPQGRNTGLTGGSVPRSSECDRPTVIISMLRLNKIYSIEKGDKMLCFAGAGIYDLSKKTGALNPPRESHSILGSFFLNPTVAAGVAFGSGGTQIRKGPAYTERALWCRVSKDRQVEVISTLGVAASSEDELLELLESGDITVPGPPESRPPSPAPRLAAASCSQQYCEHVCKFDDQVSRCNADTSGIEPCRSEGKVMILATVHDTFTAPVSKKMYWIACSSLEEAQRLKREVLMSNPDDLPVSCEYMDRDCVDVVDRAGRVMCFVIDRLGIGEQLSSLWGLKLYVESLPLPFFDTLPDRVLYVLNSLLPPALPPDLQSLSRKYDHHLLITLAEFGGGNMRRTEDLLSQYNSRNPHSIKIHTCNAEDVNKVTYFRFSAAPAFRTWCVGRGVQGLSVDYAQTKSDSSAPDLSFLSGQDSPLVRMRYAHLGCNVVHEDIAFRHGVDVDRCKLDIKRVVESRGGKLPAEHGHGTEYEASKVVLERWMAMDPNNVMNPGVGGTKYTRSYSSSVS